MFCTRIFRIDAAHRVLEHKSKCKHLHGHSYTIEVQLWAPNLDKMGFVLDFGDIKELFGTWLDTFWDHNVILNSRDPILSIEDKSIFAGKDPYVLNDKNPTAEVLAEELFNQLSKILLGYKEELKITQIRLYETPNCYSDYYSPYFEPPRS